MLTISQSTKNEFETMCLLNLLKLRGVRTDLGSMVADVQVECRGLLADARELSRQPPGEQRGGKAGHFNQQSSY